MEPRMYNDGVTCGHLELTAHSFHNNTLLLHVGTAIGEHPPETPEYLLTLEHVSSISLV